MMLTQVVLHAGFPPGSPVSSQTPTTCIHVFRQTSVFNCESPATSDRTPQCSRNGNKCPFPPSTSLTCCCHDNINVVIVSCSLQKCHRHEGTFEVSYEHTEAEEVTGVTYFPATSICSSERSERSAEVFPTHPGRTVESQISLHLLGAQLIFIKWDVVSRRERSGEEKREFRPDHMHVGSGGEREGVMRPRLNTDPSTAWGGGTALLNMLHTHNRITRSPLSPA